MKLGGFALKKGRKKALVASAGFSAAAPTAPQEPEKVFVTDFDPNAPAELTADGQKPLVIPLLETNAWQQRNQQKEEEEEEDPKRAEKDPNGGGIGPTSGDAPSADEQAAAQLVAEAQKTASATPDERAQLRDLVIPVADAREQKRAELFQDGDKRPKSDQKKPILQQNAVPGLDALQDVTDKYRHDVALRPEAPDVHSDTYESVPVEAFGAALLRGMGWTGDVDPDDMGAAPQPRHKLLGLGATKRPTLPGEDKKKRKKRRDDAKDKDKEKDKEKERRSGLNADHRPRDERRDDDRDRRSRKASRSPDRDRRSRKASRSPDRDRDRRRSRSRGRSDRRKRSRSRSRSRERDRDRRRDRHSRSDRHSRC